MVPSRGSQPWLPIMLKWGDFKVPTPGPHPRPSKLGSLGEGPRHQCLFFLSFLFLSFLNRERHVATPLWGSLAEPFLESPGVTVFGALKVPGKILPVSSSPLLGWGWAGGPGWEGLSHHKEWKRGYGTLTAVLKSFNQSPYLSSPLALPPSSQVHVSRSSGGFCSANQVNSLYLTL